MLGLWYDGGPKASHMPSELCAQVWSTDPLRRRCHGAPEGAPGRQTGDGLRALGSQRLEERFRGPAPRRAKGVHVASVAEQKTAVT